MAEKYINIIYPFRDSKDGFFLDLSETENQAIKSDLLHLILTRKGQRLYNPEFGTDLLKFIFEPNDSLTLSSIKFEIDTAINKYLPNLKVTDLKVEQSMDDNYAALVRIDYEITGDVFTVSDFVILQI